jgi:hypothetical protein
MTKILLDIECQPGAETCGECDMHGIDGCYHFGLTDGGDRTPSCLEAERAAKAIADEARADERKKIVAWLALRRCGHIMARRIEAGEHEKGGEKGVKP